MTEIRRARPEDAELVAQLIVELAHFERLENEARPEVEALRRQLAPTANPPLCCLLAYIGDEPAGFAIWFYRYSTFLTNWGVHLEDAFVRDTYRHRGIGKAFLVHLEQNLL